MVDLGKNSRSSRIIWTDDKVRHLIQVVCYVDEELNNKKLSYRVKWKSVSELMTQKGFSVSPEQCFDKFYDLNRRCKRLNDLLGIGRSEKVVKNPALLDSLEDLPETTKKHVRRLLGSRPLFYEEIRNYHSRPHIPADPGMESSTLKSSDDHEALGGMRNENEGDDENDEVGEDSNDENDRDAGADGIVSSPKRMKLSNESNRASGLNPENLNPVISGMLPDNARTARMQPDNAKTTLMQPSDNVHEFMRSTAPENQNPVMAGMVPDNARTTQMQPDSAKTPSMLEKEWFKSQNIELKRVKLENDTDAYAIGSYPKRMKLSKESEGVSDLNPENLNLAISGMLPVNARTTQIQPSDNLDECIRSTAPENLSAVMSGILPDNARTARMQPDSAKTARMQPDSAKTTCMLEKEGFKWQNIELKSVKLENEDIKVENERIALQLKEKDRELEALQLKQKDRELENEKLKLQNERMALRLKEKDRELALQLKQKDRELENEMMKIENERMTLQQKEKYRKLERKVKERKVGLEKEAFELEKMKLGNEHMAQQLKQDRELERLKLENEKLKLKNEDMALQLKNERMALQLKQNQKKFEIEYNKSEAATTPRPPTLKRFRGRKQT